MRVGRSFVVAALIAITCGRSADVAMAQTTVDPWRESATLEAANDLSKARSVLVNAFGETPSRYDACMRIAWLSLRLGESRQAVALYRHAAGLPDAGGGAKEGLITALTADGYDALARGDRVTARREWQEALTLDPGAADARRGLDLVGSARSAAADIWFGYLGGADDSTAKLFYLAAPVRVNDQISVRGVFRTVGGATNAPNTTPFFGSQQEYYGGVTVEQGRSATEVVVFGLHNTLENVGGLAGTTRFGGARGVRFTAAAMHQTDGWNTQLVPQVYIWPRPWIGFTAGVRITDDPSLSATSAVFGGTLQKSIFTLDAHGHAGTERWAFAMAGPTIMSFAASTRSGATITTSVAATRAVTVQFQVQIEQLGTQSGDPATGHYVGIAGGIRWVSGTSGKARQ